MAVYFSIEVCAGIESTSSEVIAEAFAPLDTLRCSRRQARGYWWVSLIPVGFGHAVPADAGAKVRTVAERLEVLERIYERLATLDGFELALAGNEIEERLAVAFEDGDDDLVSVGAIAVPPTLLAGPGTIARAEHAALLTDSRRFSNTHVWSARLGELAALWPAE